MAIPVQQHLKTVTKHTTLLCSYIIRVLLISLKKRQEYELLCACCYICTLGRSITFFDSFFLDFS